MLRGRAIPIMASKDTRLRDKGSLSPRRSNLQIKLRHGRAANSKVSIDMESHVSSLDWWCKWEAV